MRTASQLLFAILRKRLKIIRSARTAYVCVLSGYENKLRIFPYRDLSESSFIGGFECLLRFSNLLFKFNRVSFHI